MPSGEGCRLAGDFMSGVNVGPVDVTARGLAAAVAVDEE
jgi:hypothetical protein